MNDKKNKHWVISLSSVLHLLMDSLDLIHMHTFNLSRRVRVVAPGREEASYVTVAVHGRVTDKAMTVSAFTFRIYAFLEGEGVGEIEKRFFFLGIPIAQSS